MNKRTIIVIFIVLFLVLAAGGIVYYFYFLRPGTIQPLEIKAAEGEIREFNGSRIKLLKVNDPKIPFDPNDEKNYITFTIDQNSKFYRYNRTQKSKERFNDEQAKFNALVAELEHQSKYIAGLEPPNWYGLEEITADAVKPQAVVAVFISEADREIREAVAKKIVVSSYADIGSAEISKRMQPVLEFSGELKSIGADNLTLLLAKADPLSTSSEQATKEISVNQATKIYKKTEKMASQFAKEQAEYNQWREGAAEGGDLTAPSWYRTQALALTDLIVGQKVTVLAIESDDGVVVAQEIYFQSQK